MITIALTYYRSLTLANLAAALYSVRQQQQLALASEIVVLDNNTADEPAAIQAVIDALDFPVPVRLVSCKHGDRERMHAWSTNAVVRESTTSWIFFTRGDYLLAFDALERFAEARGENRFIVGGYVGLTLTIDQCEQHPWRQQGPAVLRPFGREFDHVLIDAGVWMTTKATFESVGGIDEALNAWGHSQTHFQYKLHQRGVVSVRIPQVVFYHPEHGYETPRDLAAAHRQLELVTGASITELWARYQGPDHPYRGAA